MDEHDDTTTGREDADRLEAELAAAHAALADMERGHRIESLLRDADTIDMEAARLLTEVAVANMDDADVERAVQDLREARPYLFRRASRAGRAMAAHAEEPDARTEAMTSAAAEAQASGHRNDLLRYLRLRRR